MSDGKEARRAPRLVVNLPVSYETLPAKDPEIPEDLKEVYERVAAVSDEEGGSHEGIVRDLSINGAFINGPSVPLLGRVAFSFPLPGMPEVEGVGWVLWRRTADTTIERKLPGKTKKSRLILPEGFGLLFESITEDSRRQITRLIHMNNASRVIISAL